LYRSFPFCKDSLDKAKVATNYDGKRFIVVKITLAISWVVRRMLKQKLVYLKTVKSGITFHSVHERHRLFPDLTSLAVEHKFDRKTFIQKCVYICLKVDNLKTAEASLSSKSSSFRCDLMSIIGTAYFVIPKSDLGS
jgi:hypothetical protein